VLRLTLSRAGFDVTVAHDGQQAWELAQAQSFDLIVTDHVMPHVTGQELCRLLAASDAHREIPVLILTCMQQELDAELLQSLANVRAIIPKPFSPRQFARQVKEALAVAAGNG
jgi:CheY-like chemotaxis protein